MEVAGGCTWRECLMRALVCSQQYGKGFYNVGVHRRTIHLVHNLVWRAVYIWCRV